MFSLTKRAIPLAITTVLLASSSVTPAIAAPTTSVKPHIKPHTTCVKHYHVFHAKRAINVVYAGKRNITRAERGLLNKIERCQYSSHDRAYVHKYRALKAADWNLRRSETNVVISGLTSTFGYPSEGGTTADGGNTQRLCIATRYSQYLDHRFLLTVEGRSIIVIMCDWGPASWTGRNIDITGYTLQAMGISPFGYSNGYGSAVLLR